MHLLQFRISLFLDDKNEYVSMIADLTFEIIEVEDDRIKKLHLSIERREQKSEEE